MDKNDCSGRCVIGAIIAIIFGAAFILTLVSGFLLQQRGGGLASVYGMYVAALIFLAITKMAIWYSKGCPHCMVKYGEAAAGKMMAVEKPKGRKR
ncbi:MAG: hypothetical protein HY367_01255 [Candidatus Aenigmarchaeota archaeon]|nr:hypothetical protein [Candidatus Aenigmarchaeota archaeon]